MNLSSTPKDAEALVIAEQLAVSIAASLTPVQVGNATLVNVPAGYAQKDITDIIEKANPTPNRKRGTVALQALESLILFVKEQNSSATGYIYADQANRKITAVFNDNRHEAAAGWRDHRAVYTAEFTPEFAKWFNADGKKFDQAEFAEFVEDNFADISAPFADQLLEVATTISAKTGITFSSSKRLDNGQVQLVYSETINTQAGANGAMEIPRAFDLGLRIFKNGTGYALKARLKYRLGQGSVKFWFELDRVEKAIEDAFNGYVAEVSEQSGYTVLLGTP